MLGRGFPAMRASREMCTRDQEQLGREKVGPHAESAQYPFGCWFVCHTYPQRIINRLGTRSAHHMLPDAYKDLRSPRLMATHPELAFAAPLLTPAFPLPTCPLLLTYPA